MACPDPLTGYRGPPKGLNCARLVLLNVEDPVQTCHLENVHQSFMEVHELQLTALFANSCMDSDQLADAARVHGVDSVQI
jgi:hypothetical protein